MNHSAKKILIIFVVIFQLSGAVFASSPKMIEVDQLSSLSLVGKARVEKELIDSMSRAFDRVKLERSAHLKLWDFFDTIETLLANTGAFLGKVLGREKDLNLVAFWRTKVVKHIRDPLFFLNPLKKRNDIQEMGYVKKEGDPGLNPDFFILRSKEQNVRTFKKHEIRKAYFLEGKQDSNVAYATFVRTPAGMSQDLHHHDAKNDSLLYFTHHRLEYYDQTAKRHNVLLKPGEMSNVPHHMEHNIHADVIVDDILSDGIHIAVNGAVEDRKYYKRNKVSDHEGDVVISRREHIKYSWGERETHIAYPLNNYPVAMEYIKIYPRHIVAFPPYVQARLQNEYELFVNVTDRPLKVWGPAKANLDPDIALSQDAIYTPMSHLHVASESNLKIENSNEKSVILVRIVPLNNRVSEGDFIVPEVHEVSQRKFSERTLLISA